jgi:hypothetical protein
MKNRDYMPVVAVTLVLLLAAVVDVNFTHVFFKPAAFSAGGAIVTGGSTGSCQYDYTNPMINPKLVFNAQDKAGNAVNPTVYFYADGQGTAQSNWGDESRFTDTSGTYLFSKSFGAGSTNTSYFAPGTKLQYHIALAGYTDVFAPYVIPTCGSLTPGDAQNGGIPIQLTLPAYDTANWTTTNISLGTTTNSTNLELKNTATTHLVAVNKQLGLSHMVIANMSKFENDGIRKLILSVSTPTTTWSDTIYDYAAHSDKTRYKSSTQPGFYDTYDQSTGQALQAISLGAGQSATLTVDVWADTSTTSNSTSDGKLGINEGVVYGLYLYDDENNAIIPGVMVTG